jgi:hypothetical protein
MGGSAETEEIIVCGIGIEPQHIDMTYALVSKPGRNIGWQVELPPVRADTVRKKSLIGRIITAYCMP